MNPVKAFLFKKQIKMKKTERPTDRTISLNIRNCITVDLPDGELDEVIDEAQDLCSQSYDAGYNLGMVDGALEYESDNPPINEEKSNSEYVVKSFSECKTLEDFTNVFNEIRNFSYRFM
jgi:hypothetical protein